MPPSGTTVSVVIPTQCARDILSLLINPRSPQPSSLPSCQFRAFRAFRLSRERGDGQKNIPPRTQPKVSSSTTFVKIRGKKHPSTQAT